MNAAVAEAIPQPQAPMPADMLTLTSEDGDEPPHPETDETEARRLAAAINGAEAENPLIDEIRIGFEQLRAMDHNELRAVITKRVELLESVLRERDDRRAAIETARLASSMLDLRRERALRIQRRVNLGSTLAAIAGTVLIVAVMI